jgi:hypothetical protein
MDFVCIFIFRKILFRRKLLFEVASRQTKTFKVAWERWLGGAQMWARWVFILSCVWWCRGAMRWTHRCVCWTHWGVCVMWVVEAKVLCSCVSPSVMPFFWVVFTVFRGLVRHGCGGLVGWQMVLACGSGSSDRVSGGSLSVSVWLSCVVCGTTVCLGRKFGGFGVGFGVNLQFLACTGWSVPLCCLRS